VLSKVNVNGFVPKRQESQEKIPWEKKKWKHLFIKQIQSII